MPSTPLSRRTLLAAGAAALVLPRLLAEAPPAVARGAVRAASAVSSFVADYRTNLATNLTAETNAAVRILGGMASLWRTGDAWNTGTVLAPEVLRANVGYVARVTGQRTAEQAARAFVQDRQDQSYAAANGLGPLAALYRAGALAVTSITSAPATTPATQISDAVPAGAAAGSAIGAGSPSSELGPVVALVKTLRGGYSSSNPSKAAFQYPRPWRMTLDSTVVDTGGVDAFGYPVYDSPVVVVPQLLRQRGTDPSTDGGFPSGHTNAFFLAALAYAYAVPERFQELVTAAHDLADTRIVAGMHSPLDVIGGRILGNGLAAAILADPDTRATAASARATASAYFAAKLGPDVFAAAHGAGDDPYRDREANRILVERTATYGLPAGRAGAPMTVPAGAEVLLETRLPYLTADQRREVLRTTAWEGGHPLLDGPELWGRLNLFAAADGPGRLDADTVVTMDAAAGGFSAADTWRNDLDGRGALVKRGTGTLTLTGRNRYTGGTTVSEGELVAAASSALGRGSVTVSGGTLTVVGGLSIGGDLAVASGALAVGAGGVAVRGAVTLGGASTLRIPSGRAGDRLSVLRARSVRGRFAAVEAPAGLRAEVDYRRGDVTVRLRRA